MNLKDIDIGKIIKTRVKELDISIERICNFFHLSKKEIEEMYEKESLDSISILKWSKLLEYDFFRLYSQHLILYAPPSAAIDNKKGSRNQKSSLPRFKKNLYTQELINFMLELLESGEKTKQQIIDEYKIPKTTLYKWADKYKK